MAPRTFEFDDSCVVLCTEAKPLEARRLFNWLGRDERRVVLVTLTVTESRALLNLLFGAHLLRLHPDCLARGLAYPGADESADMQYSIVPIEMQTFYPVVYEPPKPVEAGPLPPVRFLLSLALRINAGSDLVAFDTSSPRHTAAREPMWPPLVCGLSPEPPSTKVSKTRRQLSVQDLLCADAAFTDFQQRRGKANHRRQCGVLDCYKYALAGGFCIRHGGGKRCSHAGCQTVAQSGGKCKAHGGGSKCKLPGCGAVARRRGYCMAHGGRQQCKVGGCAKCAHGGGFCISHGGGKRCSSVMCTKSAQAGGFCYSHGGGKRCSAPECFQAARKGGLCIRHRKATSDSPVSVATTIG